MPRDPASGEAEIERQTSVFSSPAEQLKEWIERH